MDLFDKINVRPCRFTDGKVTTLSNIEAPGQNLSGVVVPYTAEFELAAHVLRSQHPHCSAEECREALENFVWNLDKEWSDRAEGQPFNGTWQEALQLAGKHL